MKHAACCVLLAAFLLLPSWNASAEDRLILPGENVIVTCDAPLEAWAREIIRDFPALRSGVEKPLGWSLESRVGVFLTADTERFEKMSGSPFVTAFAVPERHAIVVRVSSMTARPYFFKETFQHELCHLVLHEHIDSALLPRWLDEGVCQWVSGSLGEILGGAGRGAAGAVDLARRAVPLRAIENAFPGDEESLILAYEQSRSIVEYISTVYGKGSLFHILERLKRGDRIDDAVRASLDRSLGSLEEEWLRHIRGGRVWLIWLGENIYEVLFLVAALLTVLGFVRGAIRKRYYEDDDDEDDADAPLQGTEGDEEIERLAESEEDDEFEEGFAPPAPDPWRLRRLRSGGNRDDDGN